MKASRTAIAGTLVLAVFLLAMTGCAGKKKTAEPVKEETIAPPPPPPVQPAPPVEKEEKTVPRKISFTTIYFDFDKYNIREDQRRALEGNASVLAREKTVKIMLEGHCDERGTEEYNMGLGQRRADSVQSYLINYGISPSRISTISYGEMRPVDPGHDEKSWTKNRRCEFILSK